MNYLMVKDYARHQHYKKRNPVWIKLYNAVQDDEAFVALSDAARSHLMLIWLLASRRDNKLPHDARLIGRAIQSTSRVDLDGLIAAGFLLPYESASKTLAQGEESASDPLATAEPVASTHARPLARVEGETEREAEGEEKAVVVEAEPEGPLADSSYAIRITVTANHAIAEKWGERPAVMHHSAASQMAAELRAAGVPLDIARRSIIDQITRRKDEPPRSIHWFRPGIEQAWQQEQQRRLDATTLLSAPPALLAPGAPANPFLTPAMLAWAATKDAEAAKEKARA